VMSHATVAAMAAGAGGDWELRLRDTELARVYNLPRRAVFVGTFGLSGR